MNNATTRTEISATSGYGKDRKCVAVPIAEVTHFVADNKYVEAYHAGGMLLISDTLKQLEEELGDSFVRCHRRAIVSRRLLDRLEKNVMESDHGGGLLYLSGVADPLRVSRRYMTAVRTQLHAVKGGL